MPIYEYYCPNCEEIFEHIKSMDKRETDACPVCETTSRLIPSMFDWWFANPFTKDGPGFSTEWAHKDKLKELQSDNRRK